MTPFLLLLSIITTSTGMAIIAYQDFSKREVSDLVLAFPALGFVFLYVFDPRLGALAAVGLVVMAAVGLIVYRLGMIAQGDVMALPLTLTMIYALPYISISIAAVAVVHMAYVGLTSGWKFKRRVSVEQANRDGSWIPNSINGEKLEGPPELAYERLSRHADQQATVEESYGLPLAGYIALGSIIGVAIWLFI